MTEKKTEKKPLIPYAERRDQELKLLKQWDEYHQEQMPLCLVVDECPNCKKQDKIEARGITFPGVIWCLDCQSAMSRRIKEM